MEGGLYRTKQGALDYSHDFFGKAAFLTVSGQLQAEYFATALSNVYTFAPTFRAEGDTTLHSCNVQRLTKVYHLGLTCCLVALAAADITTPAVANVNCCHIAVCVQGSLAC